MWIAGVAVSVLLGYSIMSVAALRLSFLEKAGLAFPAGMMFQTLLMLGMDAVWVGLGSMKVVWISLVLIVALNAMLWSRRQEVAGIWKERYTGLRELKVNAVWLLFIVLTAYLEYLNWSKSMFFPTFDRDSVSGFDTIGWIASQEQTLKGLSIFRSNYMPYVNGPGSYITYMPMVQLSYAYVYGLGAETSKIIPALMYLSFLIAFYGVTRRFVGKTAAAMTVFFTLITPEMLAFSSLSITNVIHAVYASLGVAYTVLWLREGEKKFFWPSILFTAGGLWVRNESIVFVVASIVFIFLLSSRKKENWLYAVLTLLPFILWTTFMQVNGIHAEGILRIIPLWDMDKAGVIAQYFFVLFTSQNYYGLTFIAFTLALLINLINLLPALRRQVRHEDVPLLGITFLSLLLYILLIYQIEYKWDAIENVLSYSVKRFLFCFIPLLWLYTFSNRYMRRFFGWLEKTV
ncbi:MAG: hypothetical protein LBU03_03670 [Tannerellaceae bacterium]|jgi:hypothetical protein|nr:hypothetical protein [Tannerellaceae bacterium]